MIDDQTISEAVQYLIDGGEHHAAEILRACSFEDYNVVDHWMDGSEQLDGLSIELRGPRHSYEVLSDSNNPLKKTILSALMAVLPGKIYIKNLRIRASASYERSIPPLFNSSLSLAGLTELMQLVELQKSLMISVATGGPKIKLVNAEYLERRVEITTSLKNMGINDPNPYQDLWTWYGRWSDGSLPSWQSRRKYITALYQPLLDALAAGLTTASPVQPQEPTGWERLDRNVDKISNTLANAKNEEDFQTVGLLCREAIISLAQAVFDPIKHKSLDGIIPSETNAKRMLENYIATELEGGSAEVQRKLVKASVQLTVDLQHRRTANFRVAALCAEATRSTINLIAIISGQRDPEKP